MLTAEERAKVEALMRRLQQRKDAINRDPNPNLSAEDKRALRAREQLRAEAAHRQLLEASDARHARAMRDAYFKAFGMKATSADAIMADRDARQFAVGLEDPAHALKALAAAELRGDVSLSRAIAERGWIEPRATSTVNGMRSCALTPGLSRPGTGTWARWPNSPTPPRTGSTGT